MTGSRRSAVFAMFLKLSDVGRPIANAAAANPRQAQRANAVNATCADARASASLVFIAG